LDNIVDEDREKCKELLCKEFCALHQRSMLTQKLVQQASKLQSLTDTDEALVAIQTVAKGEEETIKYY
jgi:hypothetical protein